MSSSLTSSMLADLEVPHEIQLSPSGTHVVYTARSLWNRRDRWVSELWIAEIGKQYSARPIMQTKAAQSFDISPQWSPDSKSIAFLSDRSGSAAIYVMSSDENRNEKKVVSLTSPDYEKGVTRFRWSEDGQYIAYLSADEKTADQKAKDERKDDPMVFGENWEFNRLRYVDVASRRVTVLVSESCHVYDFAWSPDSKSLAFATKRTPESGSSSPHSSTVGIIGLQDSRLTELAIFPAELMDLCWVGGDLWWRANYTPKSVISSSSVYGMEIESKKWSRRAYGESNCAKTWAFPNGLQSTSAGLVVQVQDGLSDQLHLLPEGLILFDELQEIRNWNFVLHGGKNLVGVTASYDNRPYEVYSIVDGERCCLSSHGKAIAELHVATADPFYTTAEDGTPLDAVLVCPKDYTMPRPWPTIVLVHGGPYSRVSLSFDLPYFNLSAWFAAAGYAVLCVNYRGGSSHGEKYAADLRGDAGNKDYSDVIDLVKAGTERGIVDKDRVAIGGWSYGGYLSFLAVARDSTFHFQAAMCGAGATDWDVDIMTTDEPLWSIELAGRAPWAVGPTDIRGRLGSAIWQMENIKTPVLILHGERDENVHISGARAFHKGCQFHGIDCEMVVYPREGHGMFPPFERAHYIDMLERMKRFYDKHLKKNA